MKRDHLLLYVSTFGLLLAVALLLIANGVMLNSLGPVALGLVLFVLVLWLPTAWFVASVAKRLDTLAETGNDWTPFAENGRKAEAEQERTKVR